MKRRILVFLSAAAIVCAATACSATPSPEASGSASASVTMSAVPTASASPSPSGAPTDTAGPSDDPEDSGDLGDGSPDPVAPDLPATDPGPAIGADGTVQSYDPAAVATVCIPQVQTVSADATVSADPTRSWRLDAANVAVEWTLTSPDMTLAVVCVITGDFAAPEFVYVTLGDQ